MTIDHLGLCVPQDNFQEILKFYQEALKPLGYDIKYQLGPTVVGMGIKSCTVEGYDHFWLTGVPVTPNVTSHFAFRTKDRAVVDAFHAAALKHGGKDNGAPGLRSQYHANYYGAFVTDQAGNNVEVVCHDAP